MSEKGKIARFLRPKSSTITLMKEKERRKRKSEEEERRRMEKSNGCTLSFCNGFIGELLAEKNCLTEDIGLFGCNVFKNLARYI